MKKLVMMMLVLTVISIGTMNEIKVFANESTDTSAINEVDGCIEFSEAEIDIIANSDYEITAEGAYVFTKTEKVNTLNVMTLSEDTESYISHQIVLVPTSDEEVVELENDIEELQALSSTAGGSEYKYQWDSTLSIKAWVTLGYTLTVDSEDIEYIGLEYAEGGYSRSDFSVSVTSQSVVIGQVGFTPTGYDSNETVINPTSSSWYKTISSSWEPVLTNGGLSGAGVDYTLVLQRGGSTWVLPLSFRLADSTVSFSYTDR